MQREKVVVRVVSQLTDVVAVGVEDTFLVEDYAMWIQAVKAAIIRVILLLVKFLTISRLGLRWSVVT